MGLISRERILGLSWQSIYRQVNVMALALWGMLKMPYILMDFDHVLCGSLCGASGGKSKTV